tara:strand:+ start:643 stop:1266 length:624 start_codon:yes stop_codon:yes gene_type:complete
MDYGNVVIYATFETEEQAKETAWDLDVDVANFPRNGLFAGAIGLEHHAIDGRQIIITIHEDDVEVAKEQAEVTLAFLKTREGFLEFSADVVTPDNFLWWSKEEEPLEVTEANRWMFNTILVHVARTWERIRTQQPHEEMPQDNIESVSAVEGIANEIWENTVIQGFLKASEDVRQDDYWIKNTVEGVSDCFIEATAENIIKFNFSIK